MDQSYSEADVSLSPSQILERLQMLRQWQLLQRGKLQKQQLQYSETSEITSSITELVSHFSNSTSYNTFRTLLQSSQENIDEVSPRLNINNVSRKSSLQNVIEGVSVLNLSGESEYINSPISSRSTASTKLDSSHQRSAPISKGITIPKKQISVDEMPILSPKKDFETLINEKLKQESNVNVSVNPKKILNNTKAFLKRGQGTARFGLKKNDFKIQNTNSLPWKKKTSFAGPQKINIKNKSIEINQTTQSSKVQVQTVVDKPKVPSTLKSTSLSLLKQPDIELTSINTAGCNKELTIMNKQLDNNTEINYNLMPEKQLDPLITYPKGKQPFAATKEKTWAAVFTKEQDDFLRKLKQSAYYKNFASPAKSTVSDASCDEQLSNVTQKREETEQNLFELIENKVSHESFAMDNSFFNRFIKRGDLEGSGESTPLVFQKCLSKNPNLMHILPDVMGRKRNDETCSDAGTCDSDYTECSEHCSSESSCCSCHTVTESNLNTPCNKQDINKETGQKKIVPICKRSMDDKKDDVQCHNDSVTATNEAMNANIAEMNSKLIATSELLKDRLKELEDEIDTFRKENANLSKMREEIDLERQKFYEEKTAFEQKFNEEKILSEYYLAEEKEKLAKQKQMYERYVREMRGRLSKKEKDEVLNLKKEIHELREEIKIKDAKSTSTIARLRNQIKIMEKDKKNLEDEVEKLKKENRRIQHSNEITRRLTNLKYLEQINRKLSNMTTKDIKSDVKPDSDVKYRSYEIERHSRSRKSEPVTRGGLKKRAKSVPNLKVTSRYAKYFSQKDSLSDKDRNKTTTDDHQIFHHSYEDDVISDNAFNLDLSNLKESNSESDEENNLEKIYNERFKSPSPNSKRTSTSASENSPEFMNSKVDRKNFFIQKSKKKVKENSLNKQFPSHNQTSPIDTNSNESNSSNSSKRMSHEYQVHNTNVLKHQDFAPSSHRSSNQRTKSPVSILSNRSSSSHKSGTVVNKEIIADIRMIPSPEPTSSKTSLSRTNLNPIEIRRPDGTRELKFPNGNVKLISADGKYSKFTYYNGDVKENFYDEGRIKYYYAETKTFHTTQPDGLEILEFSDGQVEKRYKDGSSEIRLPNGSVRYFDPKNQHVREEWRFPDGAALTVSASGEQRIVFPNGQVEVHAKDHKRREFPDGTIKLIYNDGTSETRYASGRVRIKDKHGNLIMDSSAS